MIVTLFILVLVVVLVALHPDNISNPISAITPMASAASVVFLLLYCISNI